MDAESFESSSGETSPIQYSFYFEMKPLRKLRLAIEAMADREFSTDGVGRIDVDDEGFEILVRNSRNNVAHLWLDALDTVGFHCFKPVIGKFVRLGPIAYAFPGGLEGDDDVVRVFHVLESDELFFVFMTVPATEYSAKFIESNAPIERFSPVTVFCRISTLTLTMLNEMIEYTSPNSEAEDRSTRKITFYMMYDNARFKLGIRKWMFVQVAVAARTLSKHFEGAVAEGSTGLVADQIFWSSLNLTYIALLKKASLVEKEASQLQSYLDVCFLSVPEEHVVFRFRIEGRSHLAIVKEKLSAEHPETNYSFYLEMRPLHKLRLAIEAMADRGFNHDGFATIGANEHAFGFVVWNASNDSAYLWLDTSQLVSFRCYTRLFARLGPLSIIYQSLPVHLRGYEDTVSIFNVQGTSEVCFKIGNGPTALSVVFNRLNAEDWYPTVNVRYGTSMLTEEMRQMIIFMLQAGDPSSTVLVTMKDKFSTFALENGMYFQYDYSQNRLSGTTGLHPGQIYEERFNWSYTEMLKIASSLDFEVGVYFLEVPEDHIMFRFSIGGKGFLSIVKKKIFRRPDIDHRTAEKRKRSNETTNSD